MAKLNSFTTFLISIFLLGLFATWTSPLVIGDAWIEKIHDEHEGYFWLLGLGFASIIALIQGVNYYMQKKLEAKEDDLIKCAERSRILEVKIEKQNKQIIDNQIIYIERLDAIHQTINENADRDQKAWESIRKHDTEIGDIKKLMKKIERIVIDHDAEIKRLKK